MRIFANTLSILILFLAASTQAAEFPAAWKFITLHTAHFDIVVNAKQQDLGVFYARKLERAYDILKPVFTDVPPRITVLLADKTDLTNGYATRLPYPHVVLFPVLPGPQESIGETGDWALELAIHELTHVMTFEAVSGVMEPLQSVFGNILSPNLLLPTWWKEGVAVQTETQFSRAGRLRSVSQDGVLRALTDEGLLARFDIASVNERLPFWTEGATAYIFGSIFWSEAVQEKGTAVIDQLHQAHGGRAPYAIEKPARTWLGSEYEDFYNRARNELEARLRRQLAQLKTVPLVAGEPLQITTEYMQVPRISPDGRQLAMIAVDETDRRSLRVFLRNEKTGTFVEPIEDARLNSRRESDVLPAIPDAPASGSISRISWFPDSKQIVFDKVDWVSSHEAYSDLWIFDTTSMKSRRLTLGLRAREPFVSHDGRKIFFIQLDASKTALAVYDIEKKTSTVLWQGSWQDRLSFPVENQNGDLIFALRGEDGWEGLRRLRPGSTTPEVILDDFKDARFPEASPQGLLFTSSQNGVHNLYLSSPDFLTAKPLTHVPGSVYASTVDQKQGDFYITTMTARGPQVHRVPATQSQSLPPTLPLIKGVYEDRFPKTDKAPADPEVKIQVGEYSAGSYLWPQYWIPFISVSSVNNSVIFEASTSGFDPLKKHLYSLNGGWDFGAQEGYYSAVYQNNTWDHALSVMSYRAASYLVSTENSLVHEGAILAITPDTFRLNRYLNLQAGWQFRRTTIENNHADRAGPSLIAQYVDYGKSGRQISPEEGGHGFLAINHFLPGPEHLHYTQYQASGSFYWSRWLPKRHVIATRVNSSYVQEKIPSLFGASTTNYFSAPDPAGPNYVVRGYRVGHFFGKTLSTASLEYRLPLHEFYSGSGTMPWYFSRLHGAAYVDSVALDGNAYQPKTGSFAPVRANQVFGSVGAEARLETTLGYFIPMNLILGYASPFSTAYSDGAGVTFSLQIGAIF